MDSDYGYDYDRKRERERELPKRSDYERDPREPYDRYMDEDKYFSPQLSDNMRSRLTDKPRDPNESMGIFAKMPLQNNEPHHHYLPQHPVRQQRHLDQEQPAAVPPQNGYRIIVSNLHSSVTDGDVRVSIVDILKS